MAYKVFVARKDSKSELVIHDDGNIEILSPDTNVPVGYLLQKLNLINGLYALAHDYDIVEFRMTEE